MKKLLTASLLLIHNTVLAHARDPVLHDVALGGFPQVSLVEQLGDSRVVGLEVGDQCRLEPLLLPRAGAQPS